ncbi:hypothetical protein [Pseudomonas entomophila]|uniref:Uncharacterized protein n=2 Tax=Pseudomonas entomophila TaxID=312306 RepID=Q1IAW5_PSEE4|nr:hypothetical protein [Pseudomonas entomophila]WMW04024.1 hypothetical protein RAH46_16990 [Pseudomonas entomophila]CAK15201.1 hypothetical protein PSEEN2393 [Pseudomonas entomophila L48]
MFTFKTAETEKTTASSAPQVLSEADLELVSGGDAFTDIGMNWANDPFVRLKYSGISWPKGGAQWWAK